MLTKEDAYALAGDLNIHLSEHGVPAKGLGALAGVAYVLLATTVVFVVSIWLNVKNILQVMS